jgi:3-dehydroquinate synthase
LEQNASALLNRDAAAIEHAVLRSCQLKADVVEKDEREELGLRMALNYGHTFAHAFESVAGYGTWLHGEAVAAGMVCASRLAERRGLISHGITRRQLELLTQFGLPVLPLPQWDAEELLGVMRRDKKNTAGKLRFILPIKLGEVAPFDDITDGLVREILTTP